LQEEYSIAIGELWRMAGGTWDGQYEVQKTAHKLFKQLYHGAAALSKRKGAGDAAHHEPTMSPP
jgi:hypothetical protein